MIDWTKRFLTKCFGEYIYRPPEFQQTELDTAIQMEAFGFPKDLWLELQRELRSRDVKENPFFYPEAFVMAGILIGWKEARAHADKDKERAASETNPQGKPG